MPISKGPNCFGDVMGEFKRGELSSGKNGPTVKSRKQAKAIASSMCHTEDAEPEHGCGCSHTEDPKMDKRKEQLKAYGFSEAAIEAVLAEMDARYGYKESTAERKEAADRGFEAKRQRKEGKKGEAHETDELMKLEDERGYGEKKGLWANIHAKRERIKRGSGERMRKPGEKGAPSEKDLKDSQSKD